ncbi:jg2799 [Pararge aegeria aegeria]|uniref:Jg2799 protein n=1 Tax=Pararge aegeria aegeria TaxID=348720 RepID=A0A8S4QG45_9NEOP|nr:jg2799 [Pararge aegeria aegeria]
MDVEVPRCCSGNSSPVNAALVDPRPGGQMTSSESRGAAGLKRPRIMEFAMPYKRPMCEVAYILLVQRGDGNLMQAGNGLIM